MPRPLKRKINVAPKHEAAAELLKTIPRGDLEEFLGILEGCGDPKMLQLSCMLQEAKHRDRSLAQLCAMNGIGFKDVAQVIEDHKVAAGRIDRAKHIPAVLETNAVAAKGRKMPCSTCSGEGKMRETCKLCQGSGKVAKLKCEMCEGIGTVLTEEICQTCEGTKWLMQAGDPNALKSVMESTGLSAKGGISVNVTQNNANFSGAGSFEDLMRDAERKQIVEVKAE